MNKSFSFELKNIHLAAILSFLTLLLAFNQPWVTSMDGDSIVYLTISKTMAEQGNWLTPVYNSKHFFDHPPLVFWVNALLFSILGSEEWVAKLFSGFSGLGAILLVFHMGTRYANQYVGFYAGLSMLLTYDFVKYLNKCRLDMPLVFFFACALCYFLKWTEGENKAIYLSGFFAGLCFLTKGIVACGVFLIAFILLWDLGKISYLKKKEMWLAVLLSLVIPGAWVAAQYGVNGSEFFEKYFFKQIHESIKGRTRPYSPFYYAWHLLKVYWPWLPLLIYGIVIAIKDSNKYPLWRLSLVWCGVVFFAFSSVRYKIHYYLLPMFPAISLLVGRSLDHLLTAESKMAGIKMAALAGVGASFFIAISPIDLHHNRYPEIYKMAPFLRDILAEDDLIIAYRNQEGITTPSLYLINDNLKIKYCNTISKLQDLMRQNEEKRVILYTSDKNVKKEPEVVKGFYPFIENNGMRFYSRDPGFSLSGRIY